ncbi:MAG: prepilin peptidase [Kiritimatiellae bacterium]|nr:prepilin peptidase [Kiritimatiellia bacterium]
MIGPFEWPPVAMALVAGLFGACAGSFLNVCIYRIPKDLSIVRPGSRCPACGTPIAWYDNIPIVSWLVLRARCRHCRAPISPRYVMVEALVAALWAALAWRYGWSPMFGLGALAVAGLTLATFVDLDEMYIPDRVSLGGVVVGLVAAWLWPELHDADRRWVGLARSAVGAAVGAGVLALLAWAGERIFGQEAMGMGDVKLMGAIGACFGWPAVLFTFLVSSLFGAVVGLGLVALRRRELRSAIPFGPFLALGATLWLLGGQEWWELYMATVGRWRP